MLLFLYLKQCFMVLVVLYTLISILNLMFYFYMLFKYVFFCPCCIYLQGLQGNNLFYWCVYLHVGYVFIYVLIYTINVVVCRWWWPVWTPVCASWGKCHHQLQHPRPRSGRSLLLQTAREVSCVFCLLFFFACTVGIISHTQETIITITLYI